MVELIMLLVVVGVLAVVAAPLFEHKAFEERGFYDEVASAARYAKTLAITSGCEVQLSISANAYVLNQRATDCASGAFTRDVIHPGSGTAMSAVAPGDVTLAMTNNPVVFNALGNTADQVDRTVTVSSKPFTIIGATGFVQVP